jgi:hypothetical protein
MLRWGWTKLDAKLVDQKFVRRYETSARSNVHFQEWDYMVELPAGVEGPAKRLVIREKTYKLDLPDPGGTVPILVNKKRTKAAFDLDDPRIDAVGKLDAKQKARKQRDEDRFRAKLRE